MAVYRKLLFISPIGLAAILGVFFGYQTVQWKPQQNQPVYAESGSDRAEENWPGGQEVAPAPGDREMPSIDENQLITEPQEITVKSENITLSGRVGTEFGENIAGQTVVLYSAVLRAHYSMVAGDSGEFTFTDLKPAWDYALKVSPQGMFKRYSRFPIKLGFEHEVHNIALVAIPLGTLTGRIVDSYDRPVAGMQLVLQTGEIDFWSSDAITDSDGGFSVADFPKGRFNLVTRGQNLMMASGLIFDPDAGEPVVLAIDLGLHNLNGRIYYESGQAFDGAQIFLNWDSLENGIRIRSTRKVSADAGGEFQFTGLGPGDHELVISAWRVDTIGQTNKQTIRQTVNMGVDSGELNIFFSAL